MMSTYELEPEDDHSATEERGIGVLFQNLVFGRYYPHMKKQLMCSAASIFSGVAITVRLTWQPWLQTFATFSLHHLLDAAYKPETSLPDIRYFTVGGGVLLSCLAIVFAGIPRALTLSNAIMLLGWAILATWTRSNAYAYLVSYVILELGSISSLNTNIVYITEIVDPGLRGFFGGLFVAIYALGIIIAQFITVNAFQFDPMVATTIGVLFCCLNLMFSFAIPESPIRLLLNGKSRSARTVFYWLHDETPYDEMKYQDLVKMAHKHKMKRKREDDDMFSTIFSRQFFKPLIIVLLLCTVYVGVLFEQVVSYFSYKTFLYYWPKETQTEVYLNPKAFAITLVAYAMRSVISLFVSLLIPRLKRRAIFLASAVSSVYGLMLLIVAEQFSLTAPATAVIFTSYVVCTCFGVLSIPFVVMAEYFPQPVRQFGSGLAIIFINYAQLHTASHTKFNKNIERDPVQRNTMYWFCFCAVLISTIVLFLIMPETEGLSLSQLEDVVVRGPWIPKRGDALRTEEDLPVPDVATPVDIEFRAAESEIENGSRHSESDSL